MSNPQALGEIGLTSGYGGVMLPVPAGKGVAPTAVHVDIDGNGEIETIFLCDLSSDELTELSPRPADFATWTTFLEDYFATELMGAMKDARPAAYRPHPDSTMNHREQFGRVG